MRPSIRSRPLLLLAVAACAVALPIARSNPAEARDGLRRPGHVPVGVTSADEAPAGRKVVGDDDRIQVERTTRYPFSAIGKLYARFLDGSVVESTAVMLGPEHALTVAHGIFDPSREGFAVDLEFVFALDRQTAPYGSAFGKELQTFPAFIERGDLPYDVALVKLDVEAGTETGWLGLAVADDAQLLDWPANTAGYPLDLLPADAMWYAGGFVAQARERTLVLDETLDATQGQDGSPVWRLNPRDERFLIGLLARDNALGNVAVRINHELYGYLTAWLDGFDGPADLVPSDVETDLPYEIAPLDQGTVTCDVRNRGERKATTLVEAYLRPGDGDDVLLGSVETKLGAGQTATLDIPSVVPDGTGDGAHTIVVVANGDFSSPESSRENNEAFGPEAYRVPDSADPDFWQPVPLPTKQSEKLGRGDESRYEFTVGDDAATLKVKLRGRSFRGTALVVAPSGEQFRLDTRKERKLVVRDPSPGRWLVRVDNPPTTRPRGRRYKLVLKSF